MSLDNLISSRPIELEPTELLSIPPEVAWSISEKPSAVPQELLVAHHANGISSYVAYRDEFYEASEAEPENTKSWQIIDSTPEGEIVGCGEVTLSDRGDSVQSGKPYVSWLETYPEYRGLRRGNLIERLLVMREIAEAKVDSVLYADALLSDDAIKVIRHLVRAGLMEEEKDPNSGLIYYKTVRTPAPPAK